MMIYDFILYFFIYGFLGWCTEVIFYVLKTRSFVNRGFLNGPICPIYGIGVSIVIAFLTPFKTHFLLLYLASVILVTLLEGLTGWGMDVIFHNKWWDYSDIPFNIGGYVCLLFSALWGIACVLIVYFVHPPIAEFVRILPLWLGWTLIVVLGVVLLIDLYVTATGIFKFNHQLESMEKIAAELHDISDHIGEDIYKRTIQALEYQENIQGKVESIQKNIQDKVEGIQENIQDKVEGIQENIQDKMEGIQENIQGKMEDSGQLVFEISDELRERIADLRTRYQALRTSQNPVSRRLLKAFPHLQSKNYKESFRQLRLEVEEEVKKRMKKNVKKEQ